MTSGKQSSIITSIVKKTFRYKNFFVLIFSFFFVSSFSFHFTVAQALPLYTVETVIKIQWGLADNQLGLINLPEVETIGALTFSLDKNGNVFIFDNVKGRILKFNSEGKFIGSIGKELIGSAFCVDRFGNIYLLDGQAAKCYSPQGILKQTILITPAIKLVEGYGQHIFVDQEDNLLVNTVDQKIFTVGKIESLKNGLLSVYSSEKQVQSGLLGFPSRTGKKRFLTNWRSNHLATVVILDESTQKITEWKLTTPDVFGAVLFLGEDKYFNVYIETERITKDNCVHLEIHKFDANGNLTATLELPNNYYTTCYKRVAIDELGNIYQLVSDNEGVKVLKYKFY